MFSRDIGIDLGTANVLIYMKGKGVILNEPAVVAMDRNTGKVLEVGKKAYRMVGRTPAHIESLRPLKEGVIADFGVTELMLNFFINKIKAKGFFSKPIMLICYPTNITKVEQKAIKEAAEKAGAKKVYLEEEPKVAAIGAGINIYQPNGNMIIDIGGGTTDIAVLSMGSIVTSKSIKIAGDNFDAVILQYIKDTYKIWIGERTAENIKFNIATVYEGSLQGEMNIRGRDMVSGLPRTVTVNSREIEEALREIMLTIITAVKSVLEQTPPELSADIIDRGIILTGGGAMIHGLDQLLAKELDLPVLLAEDPMSCVVKGTGMLLEDIGKRNRNR